MPRSRRITRTRCICLRTSSRGEACGRTPFLFPDALTHFARGLGYARSGDAASARKEESRLAQLRDGLAEQKNSYWSNQVEVQRLAVSGWIALAQGARDDAVKAMRASAELEDSMEKHIVTPG